MYKFYYDLKYFPLPDKYQKEYKIINATVQSANITKSVNEGIFEVSDNFLFYTNMPATYNVLIYIFVIDNVTAQLVKYKRTKTSTYSFCLKSTELIPHIAVINVEFSTDILKPVTFDFNKYCGTIKPSFLVKKDGITVDLISKNKILYMCRGNYGIEIGKVKDDKLFFAKGEKIENSIYIFDAYIAGKVLDEKFTDRIKSAQNFINDLVDVGNAYKIITSNIHDNFSAAYEESKTLSNDGVVVQPDFGPPLKWKPATSNTVDMLVEDDLYLTKGFDGLISFKVINNREFNRSLIGEYRHKYLGEIIELDTSGKFHKVRHDKVKPNSINTYKSGLNISAVTSKNVVEGKSAELILGYFQHYKDVILEKYLHGLVLELSVDCGIIKKVESLVIEDNLVTLDEKLNITECEVHVSVQKPPLEFLESNQEKYDTIIIPDMMASIEFDNVQQFLESCAKNLKGCGKLIIMANEPDAKNINEALPKTNLILHEYFSMDKFINKPLIDSSLHARLVDYNIFVISLDITKIKPEFIFVVGLMGSGKSRFIHQIRNYIHPPSSLNIINTDNMVTEYISYILYHNNDTYKTIRKTLDGINDQTISDLIDKKQSVVLETTHIDEDYVKKIKSTHKVIGIICNTSIDQIKLNIENRNVFNIRKTAFNEDQYKKFQADIKNYVGFIDELYDFDINDNEFKRISAD